MNTLANWFALLAILAATPLCFAQAPAATEAAPPAATAPSAVDPAAEVKQRLASYMEAFNKHDAAALAEFWAEDATWTNRDTGETATGRDTIAADFGALFAEVPGAKLIGVIDEIHPIESDVMTCCGSAKTMLADGEATSSQFKAILRKEGGLWRLKEVEEFSSPAAVSPLSELEFLVGQWVDETEGAKVETTVRWGTGNSFLVRSFTVELPDEEPRQGTQVIGWDPRLGQLRSWSFESDGAFGEGTWVRDGEEWVGRMTQTLADGGAATATQILKRVDENTLEVRTIGREIDGEPLPSTEPVRVVRVSADATSPAGRQ